MNKYKYVKYSIKKRRNWINSFKDFPCMDCKVKYPSYVMDFDHRDGKTKSFAISTGSFRRSRENILLEINKCDLVCANCHRVRTQKQIQNNALKT